MPRTKWRGDAFSARAAMLSPYSKCSQIYGWTIYIDRTHGSLYMFLLTTFRAVMWIQLHNISRNGIYYSDRIYLPPLRSFNKGERETLKPSYAVFMGRSLISIASVVGGMVIECVIRSYDSMHVYLFGITQCRTSRGLNGVLVCLCNHHELRRNVNHRDFTRNTVVTSNSPIGNNGLMRRGGWTNTEI